MALGTLWGAHPLPAPQLEPNVEDGRPPLAVILRWGCNVEKKGLYMPWPLHAAISLPPPYLFLK